MKYETARDISVFKIVRKSYGITILTKWKAPFTTLSKCM